MRLLLFVLTYTKALLAINGRLDTMVEDISTGGSNDRRPLQY